jgi:hypothetical protein
MPGVPVAAAIVPNPAILVPPTPAPEVSYYHNGAAYTETALRGYGFTDAHFATMQRV